MNSSHSAYCAGLRNSQSGFPVHVGPRRGSGDLSGASCWVTVAIDESDDEVEMEKSVSCGPGKRGRRRRLGRNQDGR